MLEKVNKSQKYITLVVLILAISGLSGGSYLYYQTAEGIKQNTADLEIKILEMDSTIVKLENKNNTLTYALQKEQEKNGIFETQIGEISGTVGKLDKLSKTDKELLQKYSKVYFLNEHYVPDSLATITPEFLANHEAQKIHAKVWPFLEKLLLEASS